MATTAKVEEIPESTRTRLLSEAASLFRERGFAATTTREIAARLGINKASLYHHAPSKESLLHDICVESLRRTKTAFTQAMEKEPDPTRRISALIHAHVQSMLADLEMHATMLFEMRGLTGEYSEHVKKSRHEYEVMVLEVVAGAQKAGALRTDMTARRLAMGLLNMLNWTLSWYSPRGDLSPGELADVLADLYLNGGLSR